MSNVAQNNASSSPANRRAPICGVSDHIGDVRDALQVMLHTCSELEGLAHMQEIDEARAKKEKAQGAFLDAHVALGWVEADISSWEEEEADKASEDEDEEPESAPRGREWTAEDAKVVGAFGDAIAAEFNRKIMEAADSADGGLRSAVITAIADIEGIVKECRQALDRAASLHLYIAGNPSDDSYYPAEENMRAKYADAMAESAGALVCLLTYLEPLNKIIGSEVQATKARVMNRDVQTVDAAAEE
jgi:hypothetical protein